MDNFATSWGGHAGGYYRRGRTRHRYVRLRDANPLGAHREGIHRRGELNIRNARHAEDPRPLDDHCTCPACRDFSRAYLHHLFKANEILGPVLLTWHNLTYYQDLMMGLRNSINEGTPTIFTERFHTDKSKGDIAPL